MVKGYAKGFGVDRGCAVKELQLLGVDLDAQVVAALGTTLRNRRSCRQIPDPTPDPIPEGYGSDWDDELAHIAGFTSGGAPFGATWEDMGTMGDSQN